MHLKSPTLLVFVIVLSLLFISGCEKNPTTPAIEGEPEDSGYETMDDLNGISLDVMKIAFDLTDTVMAMGGSSPPLFKAHKISTEILDFRSLEYTYSNFWHIFSFSVVMVISEEGQTDSMQVSGVDSLRFKNSGTIVQYPDELLTDEMDIRQHVGINAYSADGVLLQIIDHADINVTAESLTGEVITLDGTITDSVEVTMDEPEMQFVYFCGMELNSTQTYNDLVIDETQDCPASGSIGISALINIYCIGGEDAFSVESTWTATYTFSNGTVSIDIYSAGQHWQSSTVCGGV